MTTQSVSSRDDLTRRITQLIELSIPEVKNVVVQSVTTMFGGNARKAWSFDLSYHLGDIHQQMACVMLSQGAGRQIDTSVAQEFGVLQGLNGKGTRVPAAIAMDAAGEIIGAPSIVLERLTGQASAVDFLKASSETGISLTEDLALVVAELHAVNWNPGAFDEKLKGLSERQIAALQIEHWCETFLAQRLEPLPVMHALFNWLRENLPTPQRICLVHGDLRPGNFLYENGRVSGLLDWEMAHLGDPTEDIGWIFRPLWSPERFVSLREFVRQYGEHAGRSVAWRDVIYYRVFSELKFATISLTATRAFTSASTRNMRHADRAATVAPCLKRCLAWIELHRQESANV